MINLLLPTEARAVRRDYRRRIWTTAGLLMLSLILVMLVVIGSLYWFTRGRLTDARQALATSKQALAENDLDQLLAEIKMTNERLKRLSPPPAELAASVVIKKIIEARPAAAAGSQIVLQKISYAAAPIGKVVLSGHSPTRAEFLKYLEILRQLSFVARVDSPVRNLIQEKNLSFAVDVTLK